jgi:hypothetical protein
MGAGEPTPKMKTSCHKAARQLYDDTASGKLHNPTLKQVFFYQLWRNFTKSDKSSADYVYWHEGDLGKHDFAPVVKLSVGKRIFGKMINGLLGQVTKKWSLLGS